MFTDIRNVKMRKDGAMQFEVWDNVEPNNSESGDYCSTKKIDVERLIESSEFCSD